MATALAACGAVLVLVSILSPLHYLIKRLCQGWLCRVIPKQLDMVAWCQLYTHPLLDTAVLISAATVSVEFYVSMLAIIAWCGYQHLSAVLVAFLGLSGYTVFALKDLLESPRPADCVKASPRELKLIVKDYSGDIEDGIPSAHCTGSATLVFYTIAAASAAGYLSSGWQSVALAAGMLWVIWIAWGRMYLGLHSPLDLATGSLLGVCLLQLWQQVEQHYSSWLATGQHLPLVVLLVSFVLMRCYPMPSRLTTCYQYATAWCGGWCGVTIGYKFMHLHGAAAFEAAVGAQALSLPAIWVGGVIPLLALKVLLGLLLVIATKLSVKQVMLVVLGYAFRTVPAAVRCLWQPPVVAGVMRHPSDQSVVAAIVAKEGKGKHSSKVQQQQASGRHSSHSSIWVLRHAPDGVPNDVVATARFASYMAVGYVIQTLDLLWKPLLAKLMYTTSMA